MGFFKNLFKRKKSIQYTKAFHRSHVSLDSVLGAFRDMKSFNQSVVEALEDTLIMADVGLETTELIINEMLERHKKTPILNEEMLLDEITEIIANKLHVHQPSFDQPTVVFMVGVNGAGKTTTIGKLAHQYQQTHQVKIIAADTFRAAAIDQLKTWADRSNASFYTQTSKDPSAVIYDGLKEAKEDGSNLILIDTAGRLQSKEHLMAQLNKMRRVIDKAYPNVHVETLLVIDGTTGQNGLSQAKIFHESTDVNGVVITKLDGTTKGGILLAISNILNLPISYIGLGETIEDLVPFDTIEYVLQLVDAEGEINHDN
jgi:fused signal recognition particle receptor